MLNLQEMTTIMVYNELEEDKMDERTIEMMTNLDSLRNEFTGENRMEKISKIVFATSYIAEQSRKIEELKNIERKRIKVDPKFYLGHFEITTGEVVVSDPCYTVGTWCQSRLNNVENGQWNAVIEKMDDGDWGVRVSSLLAYTGREPDAKDFELQEGSLVAVDSGQAGIFDINVYRNDDFAKPTQFLSESRQEEDGEKWYSSCCDATMSSDDAGVIIGGVVSSSGYGDGSYELFTVTKEDKVVAIKILFITEEDNDDE
jgi:hypothetical protein